MATNGNTVDRNECSWLLLLSYGIDLFRFKLFAARVGLLFVHRTFPGILKLLDVAEDWRGMVPRESDLHSGMDARK